MDFIDWPNGYISLNCEYFAKLRSFFTHFPCRSQISGHRISIYGTKKSTPVLENYLKPFFIFICNVCVINGLIGGL